MVVLVSDTVDLVLVVVGLVPVVDAARVVVVVVVVAMTTAISRRLVVLGTHDGYAATQFSCHTDG